MVVEKGTVGGIGDLNGSYASNAEWVIFCQKGRRPFNHTVSAAAAAVLPLPIKPSNISSPGWLEICISHERNSTFFMVGSGAA